MGRFAHLVELAFDLTGKLRLSPSAVGKTERPQQARTKGSTWTELESSLQRFFGCIEIAGPRRAQPQKPKRSMKMRIEFQRSTTVHLRCLEVFAEGVDEGEIRNDRRRQRIQLDRLFEIVDRNREPPQGRVAKEPEPRFCKLQIPRCRHCRESQECRAALHAIAPWPSRLGLMRRKSG